MEECREDKKVETRPIPGSEVMNNRQKGLKRDGGMEGV
jgi:hypothetical protein